MAFYLSNAQITDAQWQKLARRDVLRELGDYHPSWLTVSAYERCDGPDHLSKILYTDIKTYLPGDILVKVDRMSMAHALEVRAPLLDYELVEFAGRIPSRLKLDNGEKKRILRDIFRPLLPANILNRRKMGFSPPLAEWFRGELKATAEEALLGAEEGIVRYFNIGEIRKLWNEHQAASHDHGALLWSLLMFQLWWLEYMGDIDREPNGFGLRDTTTAVP